MKSGAFTLHPAQYAGLMATAPILLMIGGIRSGKTTGGAAKMITHALQHPTLPDEYHAIVSPTFPMSLVPVDKMFAMLYDRTIFPVCPLVEYKRKDRVFVLRALDGGISQIKVFSMHQPNYIRGFKILSIWYDEGSYGTLESWNILQGRVADTSGPIWVTATPAGYNWVYDIFQKALLEKRAGIPLHERTHRALQFTSLQNPFIQDMAGFNRLISSYDELTYQQEVLARFIRAVGLVYYAFHQSRNLVEGTIDPSLPLWVGQDFNVAKMASTIAQPFINEKGERGAHIKYERLAPDSNTEQLIGFLDKFTKAAGISKEKVEICPDASGKARSTSGRSDFQLLRAAGYRVNAPESNPFIRDRINNVNSLFAPRLTPQYPRLVVDPRCVHHIETYEKQTYADSDPPLPDKKSGLDHIGDSCGYLVTRKLPIRPAVKFAAYYRNKNNVRKAA